MARLQLTFWCGGIKKIGDNHQLALPRSAKLARDNAKTAAGIAIIGDIPSDAISQFLLLELATTSVRISSVDSVLMYI
jgi:hypothetical protein